MTEQRRREIRADLARAMGWDFIPSSSEIAPPYVGEWYTPLGKIIGDEPPNFFTSAAASNALVTWLAADSARWFLFVRSLVKLLPKPERDEIRDTTFRDLVQDLSLFMTASYETITLAAAKALGITE